MVRVLRSLLAGQSTIKSLHKMQIVRELFRLAVYLFFFSVFSIKSDYDIVFLEKSIQGGRDLTKLIFAYDSYDPYKYKNGALKTFPSPMCFAYKEKTLISLQFISNNPNCYEKNGHFPR